MGIAQIENPAEAFSAGNQDNYPVYSNQIITMVAAVAITSGQLVSAEGNPPEVSPCTTAAALAGLGIGVAVSTAVAGGLVEVCVSGVALVNTVLATFAPGAVFSAGPTGIPTTAIAAGTWIATLGVNFGAFLQTTVSTTPAYAFIHKI